MHNSERCSIYGTRATESQLMITSLSGSILKTITEGDNGQGNQGKSHYGYIRWISSQRKTYEIGRRIRRSFNGGFYLATRCSLVQPAGRGVARVAVEI